MTANILIQQFGACDFLRCEASSAGSGSKQELVVDDRSHVFSLLKFKFDNFYCLKLPRCETYPTLITKDIFINT